MLVNDECVCLQSSSYETSSDPCMLPRYLEGQSGVTIQHVSCGDLFTACLTGIIPHSDNSPHGSFISGLFNLVFSFQNNESLNGQVLDIFAGSQTSECDSTSSNQQPIFAEFHPYD